jgi:hypothetical protein
MDHCPRDESRKPRSTEPESTRNRRPCKVAPATGNDRKSGEIIPQLPRGVESRAATAANVATAGPITGLAASQDGGERTETPTARSWTPTPAADRGRERRLSA